MEAKSVARVPGACQDPGSTSTYTHIHAHVCASHYDVEECLGLRAATVILRLPCINLLASFWPHASHTVIRIICETNLRVYVRSQLVSERTPPPMLSGVLCIEIDSFWQFNTLALESPISNRLEKQYAP